MGAVAVEDTVRPGAKAAVARLGELKIERIVMLTGDNPAAARPVAEELGIGEIRTDLMPDEKVAALRQIQKEAGPAAMVGDGINDAASLAAADVGIAIAKIGADGAIDSAEMVLVGDDLRRLPGAIALSRWMQKIVWQSILAFALVFNVLGVTAASLGWLSPLAGAVLHQACSLIVVLNSLRLAIDYRGWQLRIDDWRAGLTRHAGGCSPPRPCCSPRPMRQPASTWSAPVEMAVVQHFGEIVRAGRAAGPALPVALSAGPPRGRQPRRDRPGGDRPRRTGRRCEPCRRDGRRRVPRHRSGGGGWSASGGKTSTARTSGIVSCAPVAESALRAELAGRAGDEILGARQAIEQAVERPPGRGDAPLRFRPGDHVDPPGGHAAAAGSAAGAA